MSSSATAGAQAPSWPGEKGWAGGRPRGWGSGRGSDVGPLPSLLKVHLQLHGFSVFIDVEKLEAGKFEDKLIQSVMGARNFVLVLSARALDKCMQDYDCKDWVHKVGAPWSQYWPMARGQGPPPFPSHSHPQPSPRSSGEAGATALSVIGLWQVT